MFTWYFLRLLTLGLFPVETGGESGRWRGHDEHVEWIVHVSSLQKLPGDSLYPASFPIKNKAHLKVSTQSKSQVTKALLLVQTEQGTWE